MKFKTILLLLFLTIGFTFPNCLKECRCDAIEGEYFDIKGAKLVNYKKKGSCCVEVIPENGTVSFADYLRLDMEYEVDYHTTKCQNNRNWDFSLMNTALACDCEVNGWLGSKEEKLDALTVITLNDFDDDHLANDTINDLMNVLLPYQTFTLEEYLVQDTFLIYYEGLSLKPKKAPELNEEFKVKVVIGLSTGESYTVESSPIKIED